MKRHTAIPAIAMVIVNSRLIIFSSLCIALLLLVSNMAGVEAIATVLDDASVVTWAHAVNSRSKLDDALSSDVDFLETDISMGHVEGRESGPMIPIMAHPPDAVSDISLERWLDLVIARATGKGVKLDFKSIETVEPTLKTLKKHERKINFPLWLNADIIPGPVNSTNLPVSSHDFIKLCKTHFPNAVLSVGWTTYWFQTFPPETWYYGWNHVRAMADVLTSSGIEPGKDKGVTFPVRAVFACRSIPQLRWLLDVFPSSTLTVWSGKQDSVDFEDLLKIRKAFKWSRVYYDVPEDLRLSFDARKNKKSLWASRKQETQSQNLQWTVIKTPTTSDVPMSSKAYIGTHTLLFGKNATTALLSRYSFLVEDSVDLLIQGKVSFFSSKDEGLLVTSQNKHQLILVLLDNKDLPGEPHERNQDNILKIMNHSRLHTFKKDFSLTPWPCHFFKLNTTAERVFQAWTIPCDLPNMSEREIMKEGVAEVPRNMRLVLPPGPIRFGFISTGDGHVVVDELNIRATAAVVSSECSKACKAADAVLFVAGASILVYMFVLLS